VERFDGSRAGVAHPTNDHKIAAQNIRIAPSAAARGRNQPTPDRGRRGTAG